MPNLKAINESDEVGLFPLHKVTSKQEVDDLINAGADINCRVAPTRYSGWAPHVGNTPLAEAVLNHRNDIAIALLERGAAAINIDCHGNALIHLAVKAGNSVLLKHAINTLKQSIHLQNDHQENVLVFNLRQQCNYRQFDVFSMIFALDEFNEDTFDAEGNSLLMQFHYSGQSS